jgi:hypothetical protein
VDESGSVESGWQKKLKFRGLRLIGWTLPLMLVALFASSLVSHVPAKVLLERPWGEKKFITGRVDTPERTGGELNVLLLMSGPKAPPRGAEVLLRFKSVDGSEDVKRSWKLAPVPDGNGWKASFFTRIPAGKTVAYLLRPKADLMQKADLNVQFISDPERSINKYFRMAELLFYPMLALSVLGAVMVLFPHFISR